MCGGRWSKTERLACFGNRGTAAALVPPPILTSFRSAAALARSVVVLFTRPRGNGPTPSRGFVSSAKRYVSRIDARRGASKTAFPRGAWERVIRQTPFPQPRGRTVYRLRQWSALILAVVLTPDLPAQDKAKAPEKPPSPWSIDRSLTVSPQSAPTPALKYRMLPPSWEMKEGNAAPIYLRLTYEQSDAARKYWTETPKPWNLLPVDQVPLEEARKFLSERRYMMRQFERRRRTVD